MKNTNFDLYQVITDKILEEIEKNGKLNWVKEWKTRKAGSPMNAITKKPYEGINFFLLSMNAYSSQYWLTYKQVEQLGGNVKKGEKATMIVFWKMNTYTKTNVATNEEETKNVPLLRYYNVFNVEQCENITIKEDIEPIEYTDNQRIEIAEKLCYDYQRREDISYFIKESNGAFYTPSKDSITMPLLEQFNHSQAFYSTFFHEIAHSTGHAKRLNRKEVTTISHFGSCDYGLEELTAELTSAFVCAEIGISNETTERNSVAYLKNWKNAIKADKKMFLMASQRASKACKFILNGKEETQEEELTIVG
jgi:antirestriction protein ArdC